MRMGCIKDAQGIIWHDVPPNESLASVMVGHAEEHRVIEAFAGRRFFSAQRTSLSCLAPHLERPYNPSVHFIFMIGCLFHLILLYLAV